MQTKGEGRESLLTKFAQNFFQTNGVIFVGNLLGINDLKSFRLDLKFFLEWYQVLNLVAKLRGKLESSLVRFLAHDLFDGPRQRRAF